MYQFTRYNWYNRLCHWIHILIDDKVYDQVMIAENII